MLELLDRSLAATRSQDQARPLERERMRVGDRDSDSDPLEHRGVVEAIADVQHSLGRDLVIGEDLGQRSELVADPQPAGGAAQVLHPPPRHLGRVARERDGPDARASEPEQRLPVAHAVALHPTNALPGPPGGRVGQGPVDVEGHQLDVRELLAGFGQHRRSLAERG